MPVYKKGGTPVFYIMKRRELVVNKYFFLLCFSQSGGIKVKLFNICGDRKKKFYEI